MKVKLEKKFIQLGLTIFFTAIAILLVIFFIWNNDKIMATLHSLNKAMSPVFYGLVISYLLCPVLNFFEKKIVEPVCKKIKVFQPEKDKNSKKHIRGVSIVLTLIFVIYLIYLFFSSVIPELIKSIQTIIQNYPTYTKNTVNWLNQIMDKNPELSVLLSNFVFNFSNETDNWLNDNLLPMIKNVIPNVGDMLMSLSSSIMKFVGVIWNIVIGLIISLYVLASKERFSQACIRLCYAVLERKTANKFVESVRFTHHTFTGFLSGKVVDSLIIGVLCFIVLSIMKMPYTVLISVIIGVTNIIPFFGPWFGAIPSSIILLMVDPKLALYFIIFVVILQQFDGNFLGPLILSQTTGVTTFWIICSITVFSGLMGVVGMIIAVPVTGVIFAFVDNLTNGWLMKKNLPTEPENYLSIGPILEDGTITHYEYVKPVKEKKESKVEIAIKKAYLNCKFYFKDKAYRRKENRKK